VLHEIKLKDELNSFVNNKNDNFDLKLIYHAKKLSDDVISC